MQRVGVTEANAREGNMEADDPLWRPYEAQLKEEEEKELLISVSFLFF